MRNQKFLALLALSAISGPAAAISNMEGARVGEKISYSSGDSVEMVCDKNNACKIRARVGGKRYAITREMINREIEPLPSALALMTSGDATRDSFSIQFEIKCDEYADAPPVYMCLGVIHVKNGAVDSISTLKRTYSDEYRARQPLGK